MYHAYFLLFISQPQNHINFSTYSLLVKAISAVFPSFTHISIQPSHFKLESNPSVVTVSIDSQMKEVVEGYCPEFRFIFFSLFPVIGSCSFRTMLWKGIHQAVDVAISEIYSYLPGDEPEQNPFDEDGLIWTFTYLFLDRTTKRILFFSVRCISRLAEYYESTSYESSSRYAFPSSDDDSPVTDSVLSHWHPHSHSSHHLRPSLHPRSTSNSLGSHNLPPLHGVPSASSLEPSLPPVDPPPGSSAAAASGGGGGGACLQIIPPFHTHAHPQHSYAAPLLHPIHGQTGYNPFAASQFSSPAAASAIPQTSSTSSHTSSSSSQPTDFEQTLLNEIEIQRQKRKEEELRARHESHSSVTTQNHLFPSSDPAVPHIIFKPAPIRPQLPDDE